MSNPNLGFVILLVEPTRSSRQSAAHTILAKKGYQVTHAATAKEAVAQTKQIHPLVAVLDYSAGRGSYGPVCRDLRHIQQDLPLLVIIPEGAQPEPNLPPNVAVLVPPFTARKLLNRVARLRPQPDCDTLRVGDMTLYIQRRCLKRGDTEYRLTPMQMRLVQVFMSHPHEILSRRFLLKEVWDTDYVGDTRTLDVHIRWLRQFLEDDPSHPKRITTVRGVGYRFVVIETPGAKSKDQS